MKPLASPSNPSSKTRRSERERKAGKIGVGDTGVAGVVEHVEGAVVVAVVRVGDGRRAGGAVGHRQLSAVEPDLVAQVLVVVVDSGVEDDDGDVGAADSGLPGEVGGDAAGVAAVGRVRRPVAEQVPLAGRRNAGGGGEERRRASRRRREERVVRRVGGVRCVGSGSDQDAEYGEDQGESTEGRRRAYPHQRVKRCETLARPADGHVCPLDGAVVPNRTVARKSLK